MLHARSLLSKWGFDDGACPDDWHLILRTLVRTRLMPSIREDVVLYDVETIHNPIRAESVNGRPVDSSSPNDNLLTDTYVTVPYAEVFELQSSAPLTAPSATGP